MPIPLLLATYLGFVGLSLGAVAFILSLRTRYRSEGRRTRVVVHLVVAVALVVLPLVVMTSSPTARAVFTAASKAREGGT